jgi:hypothetical protein
MFILFYDAATLADTFKQKKSPYISSRDHQTKKGCSSSDGTKRPKSSMTSLSKVPSSTNSVYDIGPPSWIRKEMNTYSIRKHLVRMVIFPLILHSRKLRIGLKSFKFEHEYELIEHLILLFLILISEGIHAHATK